MSTLHIYVWIRWIKVMILLQPTASFSHHLIFQIVLCTHNKWHRLCRYAFFKTEKIIWLHLLFRIFVKICSLYMRQVDQISFDSVLVIHIHRKMIADSKLLRGFNLNFISGYTGFSWKLLTLVSLFWSQYCFYSHTRIFEVKRILILFKMFQSPLKNWIYRTPGYWKRPSSKARMYIFQYKIKIQLIERAITC